MNAVELTLQHARAYRRYNPLLKYTWSPRPMCLALLVQEAKRNAADGTPPYIFPHKNILQRRRI